MGGAPAFQLYAADFLEGCTFLSVAAVGAYIRMLCHSWEHGPIVNTDPALYKAMGLCPADQTLAELWLEVRGKWVLTDAGWINTRLEAVREEQAELSQKGKRGGRASARSRRVLAREKKLNALVNQTSTKASTQPQLDRQPDAQPNRVAETQPNDNPPISDLRSPISSLPPPDRVRDGDGRVLSDGAAWGRRVSPISQILGDHRNCDRLAAEACARGLCIPTKLTHQWRAQFGDNTDGADAAIRAAATRGCTLVLPGKAIGGDPFDFWRDVWTLEHGEVEMPKARPRSSAVEDTRQMIADMKAGKS